MWPWPGDRLAAPCASPKPLGSLHSPLLLLLRPTLVNTASQERDSVYSEVLRDEEALQNAVLLEKEQS